MADDERGWARSIAGSSQLTRGPRAVLRANLRRVRLHGFKQWIGRERDALVQTIKTALACVLAWLIAKDLAGSHEPVLAPAAALIVIQVTIYQSITRAVQYSIGVMFGVGVALAIGRYYGFTWFTLLAIVVGSLVLGRTLRLGTQVNQIAVTGLFVLSLGSHYGLERGYDTLIGTGTGVVVNALVMPPTFTRTAAKELADLSDDLAELSRRVAEGLRGEWSHADSTRWLAESRDLTATARMVRGVARQAAESTRFHPRRAALARHVRRLEAAATCLNHVAGQLNSLIRGLNDMSSSGARGVPAAVREVPDPIVALLDDSARALVIFGDLQLPDRSAPRLLEELRVLIREAKKRRVGQAALVRPDETDEAGMLVWPMVGALIESVQRILYELDPDRGPHRGAIPQETRDILGPPEPDSRARRH